MAFMGIYYTNANNVADSISYTVQDVRTNPPAVYQPGDTIQIAIGDRDDFAAASIDFRRSFSKRQSGVERQRRSGRRTLLRVELDQSDFASRTVDARRNRFI